MRSFLQRAATFAAIMLATASLIEWITPYYALSPDYRAKVAAWTPRKTAYNTYFIGSSRTFHSIDPLLFDALIGNGTRSFNFGADGVHGIRQLHFLRNFAAGLPRGATRLLVWEISPILDADQDQLFNTQSTYFMDSHALRLAAAHFWQRGEIGRFSAYGKQWIANMLGVGQLAETFTVLTGTAKTKPKAVGREGNGYYPLNEDTSGDSPFHRQFLENPELLDTRRAEVIQAYREGPPYSISQAYLDEIEQLLESLESDGVRVILLLFPRDQYSQALFERIDHPWKIDLCDPSKYPELYSPRLSFDVGHLNEIGARYFTTQLAEQIARRITPAAQSIGQPLPRR